MHKKLTALVVSTGLAGAIAGGVLMSNVSANAADDTSSAGTTYAAPPAGAGHGNGNTDPTKPMRDDEQLLTGTTLSKVTAVVKAKYPDATIQRVETDSDGVYEAHIVDNGSPVTVEVDKSYAITGTEARPAGPPAGQASGSAPAA
jgi:hypothetical protein